MGFRRELNHDDYKRRPGRQVVVVVLALQNSGAAKAEILALFSKESDDEHEWSEQDIYEQMRKVIRKYE